MQHSARSSTFNSNSAIQLTVINILLDGTGLCTDDESIKRVYVDCLYVYEANNFVCQDALYNMSAYAGLSATFIFTLRM
jgi:hypothetical protein